MYTCFTLTYILFVDIYLCIYCGYSLKGEWEVSISSTYEQSYFWNMTTCKQIPQDPHSTFNLQKGIPKEFGFSFENNATFDIIYTLTAIRTDLTSHIDQKEEESMEDYNRRRLITGHGSVFVTSAAGIAQPDIRVEEYNGALCWWQPTPIGENYFVDYSIGR